MTTLVFVSTLILAVLAAVMVFGMFAYAVWCFFDARREDRSWRQFRREHPNWPWPDDEVQS